MPIVSTSVEHEITVSAPAAAVYDLIADVENWPLLFEPTIHVEYIEREAETERIRIWATANGAAKTWTSRRTLDPQSLRVDFRQEVPQPPVGGMGGAWVVEPLSEYESRVRLLHDYFPATEDPADRDWIAKAIDANSGKELAALKKRAELDALSNVSQLLFSFDDTVIVDGPLEDVYDFINDATLWGERLPHVARVVLEEETPGLQILEMDTITTDGSTHTTKSVRVCQLHEKIIYKQIKVPALMTLHTGEWTFERPPNGATAVTSRHTVRINEANIAGVLGEHAGVDEAKDYVRSALTANSLATLTLAKNYAESR